MRKIKEIKSFFEKPIPFVVLSFLIFLPLLFLNIRHDHDWGGDFAHYLSQAENILNFKAIDNTGYLYNEDYSILGPRSYPPLFPLLIAPITYFFGDNTTPYNYLLSFLLIGLAILTSLLLKKKTVSFVSIILSVVIFYNPYFINLKSEIIADIPFALIITCFILLTYNTSDFTIKKWIWVGILAGLASSTKSFGFILFIALFLYSIQQIIYNWVKYKNYLKAIKQAYPIFLSIGIGIIVIFSLNLFFLQRIQSSAGYLNSFNLSEITYNRIGDNIYYYSEILRTFFMEMKSTELWFGAILGSAVLTFFITGLIISFNNKPSIKEWLTIVYFGVLCIYPYQNSGFRFLIPIIPLITYYALTAVIKLNIGKGGVILVIIIALVMFLQYKTHLKQIQQSVDIIQDGPYAPNVVTAFNKVKEITTSEDAIVFNKPRVLYHYIHRKSMSHKPNSSINEMEQQFSVYNPNYFLIYSSLPDASLEKYVVEKKDQITLIWQDDYFRLFKKK